MIRHQSTGVFRNHKMIAYLSLVTIILLSIPRLTAQTPKTADSGYQPALMETGKPSGSYALNDLFSVNYFTGKLNVAIPLVKVQGRGDLGFTATAYIEQDWKIQKTFEGSRLCPTQGVPCDLYYPQTSAPGRVNLSPGFLEARYADNLIYNVMTNAYTVTRLYFHRPDGSTMELVDQQLYGQPTLTHCHTEMNSCPYPPTDRGTSFVSNDEFREFRDSDRDS